MDAPAGVAGRSGRWPRRRSFRRRLVLVVALVAGISGLTVAVVSYVLVDAYRVGTSRAQALDKVRLVLLSSPPSFSLADFEAQLAAYRQLGGFETLVLQGEVLYSSSATLGVDDVPPDLLSDQGADDVVDQVATVDGRSQLVVAGSAPGGESTLVFFFDRSDLLRTLSDVRRALVLSWLLTTSAAVVAGLVVARRTLRPVGAAARAAQALSAGELGTRLAPAGDDEFGRLARSFNEMADTLQATFDELSERAARERRLTADVAHELRTPLSGIVTLATLVEAELAELEPERRRPAELLLANVARLRSLVLDLLELAQLEQGEPAELDAVSLDEPLEHAAAAFPGLVEVDVRPGPEGPLMALAERRRLARVIGNLLANAVTHGGVGVEVRAVPAGDHVVIDVLDRGPGIPEADLPRVFDRLFKSDRSRSGGGTGLGLAIALEHARAQGGTIEASNREGGGARFRLVLRAARPTG